MLYHRDIFVISLDKSIARRKLMSYQLDKLGLDYTIFKAVDGSSLSQEKLSNTEMQRDSLIYRKPFSVGEIGCMHSHMNVYKEIVSRELDYALILEDDVFLTKRLNDFLSDEVITKIPKNWDIILLAYVQRGNVESMTNKKAVMSYWNRTRLAYNFVIGRPVQFSYHAAGYLVSNKGAKNLIEKGSPLRMPADILTGNAQALGMSLYMSSKPIIRQHHEWALHSTIKEDVQDKEKAVALQYNSNKSITIIMKKCYMFIKRLFYYALNKTILCIRGHGGIVVFLRKLGLIGFDKC